MPSLADLTKEALDSTNAIDTTNIDEKIEIALACPCIGECGLMYTFSTIVEYPAYVLLPQAHTFSHSPLHSPPTADLRDGPCGQPFVSAFTCFIKSQHEEKGMDCIYHFKSFQECLNQHPDHLETILGTREGQSALEETGNQKSETIMNDKLNSE